VSSKPGRNDPCHCGSGKKYKRCCLPREEVERAEALKQQVLWDEEDDLEADDLPDEYVEDIPPFDPDAVRTVRYERGFVQTLDALQRDDALRLTEWTVPLIPRQVLECLEREAVEELDGLWGDSEVGDPIQVDIVEVVTDEDLIVLEVLNRAIQVTHTDSEDVRRIHRICETLERAADQGRDVTPSTHAGVAVESKEAGEPEPLRRNLSPVPELDFDALRKAHRRQRGTCDLCGADLTSSGAAKHVATCAPAHDAAGGPLQTLVHLRVTAPAIPGYWLELEMRDDAKLEALDRFLRNIWLECCGHLSQFAIGSVEYVSRGYDFGFASDFGSRRTQRSMGTRLAEAVGLANKRFGYEYDFGSTTALQIDIKGSRSGRVGRPAVQLLARNTPLEWPCGVCGEPAVFIDGEADGYPFLCRPHAHDDGDAALMPLVNSPRAGVCGYVAET
jgi:hypothetical protein